MINYIKITFYFIVAFNLYCTILANQNVDQFQDALGHLGTITPVENQAQEAQNLIQRIIGTESKWFQVAVDPTIGPRGKDTFKILKVYDKQVNITGTSGVAVAWGFYYYIKTYCNSHISWEGKQVELPKILPDVNETITSNDRFRYYQNVCTAGYSSTWWNWTQWEKNIDWMALNGINLALAFHAQEAIWERVYLELNLTREEIDQHFGGPAFLPWTRMGNIRGWGGPLPPSWHSFTITLQHKILDRMRKLGIIPVLPAFAGHVPQAFARIFPNASMVKINSWNNFQDQYCCPYLLSPQDPLFKIIGKKFLQAYIEEFGTDHVYNCDTYNENEPMDSDLNELKSVGEAIYSAMTEVDPQAIWVLQGWLFVNEFLFWTKERVKAFITSVPIGKMIILDLQSEQFPRYELFNSYYGQPFIWCMLHNFGGTLGMFGSAPVINKRIFEARNMNGSTMIGTGLTPEGINQNYVIYELMNEMAYRRKPVKLNEWFKNYSVRRYGAENEYAVSAWGLLRKSVYNFNGTERIRGHYVITKRPSLRINTYTWYDPSLVFKAWKNLLRAQFGRKLSLLYKHDLVDITRQSLQLIAEDIYDKLRKAYSAKNHTKFETESKMLVEVFADLENILQTNENFLLGKWISDARSLGTNDYEKDLYEYNARNQITLWGPNGEIIDYANKQWSGVISNYFASRWILYVSMLNYSLLSNKPVNQAKMSKIIFEFIEKPFTFARNKFRAKPIGDPIAMSKIIFERWNTRETINNVKLKRHLKNSHVREN